MCEYCEGKKKLPINSTYCNCSPKASIQMNKFLVVEDRNREYAYDLHFCPMCGEKLYHNSYLKIYVSNITSDKIITTPELETYPDYVEKPLHLIVCDKTYEGGETVKQVGFIVPEVELDRIKEKGYCIIQVTATSPNG